MKAAEPSLRPRADGRDVPARLRHHFSVRDVAADLNATPEYTLAIMDTDMPQMHNGTRVAGTVQVDTTATDAHGGVAWALQRLAEMNFID